MALYLQSAVYKIGLTEIRGAPLRGLGYFLFCLSRKVFVNILESRHFIAPRQNDDLILEANNQFQTYTVRAFRLCT